MSNIIPAATIGHLSRIMPQYYTHADIEGLFLTASAPDNVPPGSKSSKVQTWLRSINNECAEPLKVLGSIIADLMDRDAFYSNFMDQKTIDEETVKLKNDQTLIAQSLSKNGLTYYRGGVVSKGAASPTLSLLERVKSSGLAAIEMEINRALQNVELDPLASIHNAGSALEASLKAYLGHFEIAYKDDSHTLSDLWRLVVDHIGIKPKELDDKDLKKIASGLFSIVDGTMHLRNKKSAAHGKTEEQVRNNSIRPRHARLAIHSAHTLSAYILELIPLDSVIAVK